MSFHPLPPERAMRPADHTPEQIIEAGLALRAAGSAVTGFKIRTKLGGGKISRLKQIWDDYLAVEVPDRPEPVAELPVEIAEEVTAVAAELSARLTKLATELNDKAVKAAERRVIEIG